MQPSTVSGTFLRVGAIIPSWAELTLRSGLGIDVDGIIEEGHQIYLEQHGEGAPTDAMARAYYATVLTRRDRRLAELSAQGAL